MMTKIKIKGKYVGASKRGTIIGGVHFTNNGQEHTVLVDEKCFENLVLGQESGWFKILEHNYDVFCVSRYRPIIPQPMPLSINEAAGADLEEAVEVKAEAKVDEVNEEAETVSEEVLEEDKKPKKKTAKKKD